MKIIHRKHEYFSFSDLEVGDTFMFGNDVCIKIRKEESVANAFSFSSNSILHMLHGDKILKCKATIIAE